MSPSSTWSWIASNSAELISRSHRLHSLGCPSGATGSPPAVYVYFASAPIALSIAPPSFRVTTHLITHLVVSVKGLTPNLQDWSDAPEGGSRASDSQTVWG